MTDNPTITKADLLPVTQADRALAERLCYGMSEKALAEAAMLIARHRHSAASGAAHSGEGVALASELRDHFPAGEQIGVRLSADMFTRILATLSPSEGGEHER